MLPIQWHKLAIGVEISNMGQTHAHTRTSNVINVARLAILPGPANQSASQHRSPASHPKPKGPIYFKQAPMMRAVVITKMIFWGQILVFI